jgi:ribosomal protein S27AE
MESAHATVVSEPDSQVACGTCHADTAASDAKSLHTTLGGYQTVLYARSAPDKYPQIDEMMENHCERCHTSCGQCHVSRPTNLGGGLHTGHEFKRIPPMNLTCTGCHGSRINDEYKGKNEGVPADVHWIKGGMACFACHSADQMHGALGEKEHRYDGSPTPECVECHPEVTPGSSAQHTAAHLERLACTVCHATTYKTCYGCHTAQKDGVPYFKLDETEMTFKIGLNPLLSAERPWKYVTVRHVPIARDVYDYYGEDLLPNFDVLPTWKYATPHNIQRVTPQNQSCTNCHGNTDIFLTANDVLEDELTANEDVIVREVPTF